MPCRDDASGPSVSNRPDRFHRDVLREVGWGHFTLVEAEYPAGFVDRAHAHRFAHVSVVLEGAAVELRPDHRLLRHARGTVVAQACGEGHALHFPVRTRVLSIVMPSLGPAIRRLWASDSLSRAASKPEDLPAVASRALDALAAVPAPPPDWLQTILHSFDWCSRTPIAAGIARCGLNHAHFDRVFKRQLGMSPRAFRLAAKVRKASRLLVEGTMGLVEVADSAGFHDQSHMTTAFRAQTGLTPRIYREVFAHTAYKTG